MISSGSDDDEGTKMKSKTMREIQIRAGEIVQTCEMEYAEAGEEAIWQMADDMKWQGWSEAEVEELKRELGF